MKGNMKQPTILSMFGKPQGNSRPNSQGQPQRSGPAQTGAEKRAPSRPPAASNQTASKQSSEAPPTLTVKPTAAAAADAVPASEALPKATAPAVRDDQHTPPPSSDDQPCTADGVKVNVGQRLRVFWPDEKAWYSGVVTALHGAKVKVTYDDGDVELLDLRKEQVKLGPTRLVQKHVPQAAAHDSAGLEDDCAALEDGDEDSGAGAVAMDAADAAADEETAPEKEPQPRDAAKRPSPSAKRTAADEEMAPEEELKQPDVAKRASPAAKRKAAKSAAPSAGKRSKSGAPASSPTENAASNGGNVPPSRKAAAAAAAAAPRAALTPAPPHAQPAKTPTTSVSCTPRASQGSLASLLSRGMPDSAATPASAGTPAGLSSARTHGSRTHRTHSNRAETGLATSLVGDAARFLHRYNSPKFAFLAPQNLKDANKRAPGHPDYDPSTLYIPPGWVKENKVADGQAQWWGFKAANFDSVLLFKMGKFYELFEMDAFVGVETLGLQFMKGDQPHAGFPEAAYYTMAEQLARAGHRVVVVEQTETPEQMKEFNERAGKGQKRKVVQRTKVAVLTQGTLTEPLMLTASPDAAHAVAVVELPAAAGRGAWVGLCAVDAAAAKVLLCQFHDDELRSKLQRQLTELQASELVVPRCPDRLPAATKALLKGMLPGARMTVQRVADGAWDGAAVRQTLQDAGLFQDAVPPAIARRLEDPAAHAASLAAFAGMVKYLQDAMLAQAVLAVGTIDELSADEAGAAPSRAPRDPQQPVEPPAGATMALDGSALQNLEVLENSDGGKLGSVLATLDHCVTAGGKRLLRLWLSRPLLNVADISARQDAVEALMTSAADARDAASRLLAPGGDIERMVARLAGSAAGAFAREGPSVVLYEDPGRRRVKEMTSVLADMQALRDAVDAFGACRAACAAAPVLGTLVTWGSGMPDFRPALNELLEAADWKAAEQAGQVVPAAGVDEAYDGAVAGLAAVDAQLQELLEEFRGVVGAEAAFISMNKDSHVFEVPEARAGKVPRHYTSLSARKGFKRFSCEDLEALVAARKRAVEGVETAQGSILASLVRRFAGHRELWVGACAACAQLDALMSLAKAALLSGDGGPMCRPLLTLQPPPGVAAPPGQAFFSARALQHPTGIKLASAASFVPNDIRLGDGCAPFMLLTGPNMGGKSTLMRQVCVATLMAQVGAWLPAEEVVLSPADAIFVRMGAKDHIMMGQSTFFVELSETSAMLASVTPRSLVALDELGRGTATMDGAAIAGAVLEHLLRTVSCRGVFATHYHSLSEEHANDPQVAIKHMACHVRDADGDHLPEVTFLYKLSDGPCPKSYGANVARIAGIPRSVATRAALISEALEQGSAACAPAAPALPASLHSCMASIWAALDDPACSLQPVLEEAHKEAARLV